MGVSIISINNVTIPFNNIPIPIHIIPLPTHIISLPIHIIPRSIDNVSICMIISIIIVYINSLLLVLELPLLLESGFELLLLLLSFDGNLIYWPSDV